MNARLRLIILLNFMVMLCACNSLQVFRYEILRPGIAAIPDSLNRLLIVDNSAVQPSNVGHVVKIQGKASADTAFETSGLSELVIRSLTGSLQKEAFFSKIACIFRRDWDSEKTEDDAFVKSGKISVDQLRQLSQDADQDVLVTLDRMLMSTRTSCHADGSACTAARDVELNAVLRIYNLRADTLMDQFQFNDSLYWINQEMHNPSYENLLKTMKGLPDVQKVLPEIASIVADRVSKKIGPHWEQRETEFFSSGSYKMTIASDLVRAGKLDQAAVLWRQVYPKAIFRTKYRAAMNMVFYEFVAGHPDKAAEWLVLTEKSMNQCPVGASYFDIDMLQRWKILVKERLNDFEKLKISPDSHSNG